MCVTKISVKLIVSGVRGAGWGREGPAPPCHRYKSRGFTHTPAPGIYLTLLFTYPFICFAPISPDREFLCLHVPGAQPRKAATCERFTARITQFSSERSAFIGLHCYKLALGGSKYFRMRGRLSLNNCRVVASGALNPGALTPFNPTGKR